jgi:hypothetical protein
MEKTEYTVQEAYVIETMIGQKDLEAKQKT